MQQREYPFAKLDEFVEVRLNPLAQERVAIAETDLVEIKVLFSGECNRIWVNLKFLVFGLRSEEKIKTVISQHLLVIAHLKNQISANLSGLSYTIMTDPLDRLEFLIQSRYAIYCGGPPEVRYKIICSLSVDQMGLILKAADDTRLIQARSLSMVLKSVVPYLSTSNKTDISFDSMRSSTYHPEASDKAKAIAALERMIEKIDGYR